MNYGRTLRKLILLEVILTITSVAVGISDEWFLPEALRGYVRAQAEAPMRWSD